MTKPLPGPTGLPLVGSFVPYTQDLIRFLMDCYHRYGRTVRFDFLNLHGAIMAGAEANRYILVDNMENFLVSPLIEKARARWIVGRGLLFIDEPAHKQHRRLILPSMHRQRLEKYQQIMRETAETILNRWKPGQAMDLTDEMDDIALIVEGHALFNVDFSQDARELSHAVAVLVETVNDMFHVSMAQVPFDIPLLGGKGGTLRQAMKNAHTLIENMIVEHERTGQDMGDVVSMLLAARDEDGGRLTAQDVRDHLLTLYVAGHETVANALSWACYLLAQHPAVASKLLSELENVLGGKPPTLADLDRLPYLEMVAKESLRIYPPATNLFRTARDGFVWDGYDIPAGSVIMYTPYVSHRIPEHFPDPERFWPERFDPAVATPPPSFAYVPFGGGPRSCIGAPFAMLEIKTVLAMICQRFRLDLVAGQDVSTKVTTTLQPKYGVQVRPFPQDGDTKLSPARVRGNLVSRSIT